MIPQLLLIGLFVSSLGVMPVAHSEPIEPQSIEEVYQIANNNSALLSSGASPVTRVYTAPRSIYRRTVTAYTSSPEETDSTPFITASGKYVHIGTAAANWLPLGTAIRIPDLFGDQIFVVEDRMNKRFTDRVDIWFTDRSEALKFGTQSARIEVL